MLLRVGEQPSTKRAVWLMAGRLSTRPSARLVVGGNPSQRTRAYNILNECSAMAESGRSGLEPSDWESHRLVRVYARNKVRGWEMTKLVSHGCVGTSVAYAELRAISFRVGSLQSYSLGSSPQLWKSLTRAQNGTKKSSKIGLEMRFQAAADQPEIIRNLANSLIQSDPTLLEDRFLRSGVTLRITYPSIFIYAVYFVGEFRRVSRGRRRRRRLRTERDSYARMKLLRLQPDAKAT